MAGRRGSGCARAVPGGRIARAVRELPCVRSAAAAAGAGPEGRQEHGAIAAYACAARRVTVWEAWVMHSKCRRAQSDVDHLHVRCAPGAGLAFGGLSQCRAATCCVRSTRTSCAGQTLGCRIHDCGTGYGRKVRRCAGSGNRPAISQNRIDATPWFRGRSA